ncbi:hypothetical protein [Nocardia carnea]|uniref:hypothetical protein n=1 Tax=Nocardia carnea TaxID=37328 RepID=UPI0024589EA5|nr:hypothetical protein [Nocardia carnea]
MPGLTGVDRPAPVRYWSAADMQARWHLTGEMLWSAIVEDGSVPYPDMWLDGAPGWRAT